ncbi:MAG: hypothetical protein WAN35_20615 [Terracidiphilus sp.]
MHGRRNTQIKSAVFGAALLAMSAVLGAQTTASPAAQAVNWKTYSYPALGLRVAFPAEPKLDEEKQGSALGNIVFTSYCAQVGNAYLCAAVIDQGPEATGLTPEALMDRMMMGIEFVANTKTLNEKKIELDGHGGEEVETISDKVRITTRVYLVDNTLYQTMVTVPVTEKYADTARFLDSFRLIRRSKD